MSITDPLTKAFNRGRAAAALDLGECMGIKNASMEQVSAAIQKHAPWNGKEACNAHLADVDDVVDARAEIAVLEMKMRAAEGRERSLIERAARADAAIESILGALGGIHKVLTKHGVPDVPFPEAMGPMDNLAARLAIISIRLLELEARADGT